MSYLFVLIMLGIGVGTGLLSGLFGVGGGVILIPALSVVFLHQGVSSQHWMHLVIGTTLGAMIFTSAMATWSHHKRGTVQWHLLASILPGALLGGILGALIAKHLTTLGLRYVFAFMAALFGARLVLQRGHERQRLRISVSNVALFLFGICAGTLSGLLGLGGGLLFIPFLLWLGLTMPQISATSSACIFPISLLATVMNVITGYQAAGLPEYCWGFVYWPVALIIGLASLIGAPMGVSLAYRLPMGIMKRIFGVILIVIAWQMLPSR